MTVGQISSIDGMFNWFMYSSLVDLAIDWSMNLLIYWLINWLFFLSVDRLIDINVVDWTTECLVDWLIDRCMGFSLVDLAIDWLMRLLIDRLTDFSSGRFYWLISKSFLFFHFETHPFSYCSSVFFSRRTMMPLSAWWNWKSISSSSWPNPTSK